MGITEHLAQGIRRVWDLTREFESNEECNGVK